MTLADDLLEQADHLLRRDATRPRQASLRRAMSNAYYALFHLLTEESARRMTPPSLPEISAQLQRSFDHANMREVCLSLPREDARLRVAFTVVPPQEILLVARTFVELQRARHTADYNLARRIEKSEAVLSVRAAHEAFAAWRRVRRTREASVFLVGLLMKAGWPRV